MADLVTTCLAATSQWAKPCVKTSSRRRVTPRSLATEVTRKYARLDGLINSAANFDHRLKQAALTTDGVEVVFATNHLGPFLLTHLVLDTLKASTPVQVLNVASKILITYPFLSIEFDNLNGQRWFTTQHAHYRSKRSRHTCEGSHQTPSRLTRELPVDNGDGVSNTVFGANGRSQRSRTPAYALIRDSRFYRVRQSLSGQLSL